jgi:ADP-ribose pyrophosphatase YjhB (NUDIX family)
MDTQDLFRKYVPRMYSRFTQLRLPGGTSAHGEHFSAALIYREIKDENNVTGQFEFLLIPFDPEFYKGDERNTNKRSNETPIQTLIREIFEETALIINSEYSKEPHLFEVPSRKRPGTMHSKYSYLLEYGKDVTGDILFTETGINPISAETGNPVWVSQGDLFHALFKGHHIPAKELIRKDLLGKSVDAWQMLSRLL